MDNSTEDSLVSRPLAAHSTKCRVGPTRDRRTTRDDASKVSDVVISLKRNQVVAREGDDYGRYLGPGGSHQMKHSGRSYAKLLGLLLIMLAVYWCTWKFTEHRVPAVYSVSRNVAFARWLRHTGRNGAGEIGSTRR